MNFQNSDLFGRRMKSKELQKKYLAKTKAREEKELSLKEAFLKKIDSENQNSDIQKRCIAFCLNELAQFQIQLKTDTRISGIEDEEEREKKEEEESEKFLDYLVQEFKNKVARESARVNKAEQLAQDRIALSQREKERVRMQGLSTKQLVINQSIQLKEALSEIQELKAQMKGGNPIEDKLNRLKRRQ